MDVDSDVAVKAEKITETLRMINERHPDSEDQKVIVEKLSRQLHELRNYREPSRNG